MRVGARAMSGRGRKLETRQGRVVVVGPGPHRSEDRPLHAERIRRSWEARKCAALGLVVGLGEVASGEWRVTSDNSRAFGRAGVEVGEMRIVRERARAVRGQSRVLGRAGSGGCSCL